MSFQAYLDTIRSRTGMDGSGLRAAADAKGWSDAGVLKPGIKAGQVVDWLKTEHDLGQGHAMAVYALLSGKKRGRQIMAYFDGFVIAVPTANKQKFIDHANLGDAVFKEQGATRIVETWGDDVPKGKVTDFQGAVQAQDDETVVFSWIEWPDKATRDAAMAKMTEWMNNPEKADPRMDPAKNPMPFDGKRMIFGGFSSLVDESGQGQGGYTDGYVLPVHPDKKDAYRKMAATVAPIFREYGATRVVEGWGDDVPDGKVTDFKRSVKAENGENVVFSWVEWPDKATRDQAWAKIMEDERMKPPEGEQPFDGKRMFWGGFQPVVEIA